MDNTAKEILQFVAENDVKFIRLAFCDIFGQQKNISILPSELERAFADGISFDGSNILGFSEITKSDLLLFPDPTTLKILPWRPQQGRVIRFFCDIFNPDKTNFICDTRRILKAVQKKSESLGLDFKLGTECEFYLFKTDELGNPTKELYDEGSYMDVAPLDKGENIRREICLCLEEMGIYPQTSHHESGPAQNEIDFRYGDLLTSADNFLSFKSVVKAISGRNGLYASFLPKPIAGESGSGLHINMSVNKGGENIVLDEKGKLTAVAQQFLAGVLDRVIEITAVLNPIVNSYYRLGKCEAPDSVGWGYLNRSELIRIPSAQKSNARIELRSPDCVVNPYLAFALVAEAGLEGIMTNKKLGAETRGGANNKANAIPKNLSEALDIFEKSSFSREILGDVLVDKYVSLKRKELKSLADNKPEDIGLTQRMFKLI